MELYVMRHGKAAEPDPRLYRADELRPLTETGRRDLEQIAIALKRLELEFDLILSSPLLRARQTAEIVAKSLGITKKLHYSDLLAQQEIQPLIDELQRLRKGSQSILLIGHEPFLGELVSTFLTGGINLPLNIKKGSVLKLQVKKLHFNQGAVLEWFMTPRQLIGVAGS